MAAIHTNGREDISRVIKEFLHHHGLHCIIAFSGGSDNGLSGVADDDPLQVKYKEVAASLEQRVVSEAIGKFRGYQVAILTGGTCFGLPQTATLVAKEYGFKTIGVYPLAGKKHALSDKHLDLSICVDPVIGDQSRWGDESAIFTNLLDGVIVYGGGAGTLIECAHILKINEAILKAGKAPLKYIVPISGTGGVADGLPFIWAKPEVRFHCMPSKRVLSGLEAADILRNQLNLDDFYEF